MSWEVLTAGVREKPRLSRLRGIWVCRSSACVGFGRSHLDAYQDWQRQQYRPGRG